MTYTRRKLLGAFSVLVLVGTTTLLLCNYVLLSKSIAVKVRNLDDRALIAVSIHLAGRSYSLGDIPPNGQVEVTVFARSETHIEIEFTGPDGGRKRLDAGGYIEPGYRGTIIIKLNSREVIGIESAVSL